MEDEARKRIEEAMDAAVAGAMVGEWADAKRRAVAVASRLVEEARAEVTCQGHSLPGECQAAYYYRKMAAQYGREREAAERRVAEAIALLKRVTSRECWCAPRFPEKCVRCLALEFLAKGE